MRSIGMVLVLAGVAALAWSATVYVWQDPFTWWQEHRVQERLSRQLDQIEKTEPALAASSGGAQAGKSTAHAAARFRLTRHDGDPIGRIVIPAIGVHQVMVYGTDHDALLNGPGLDPRSHFPGQGQLVYVAGHRTTHGAPFSRLDELRKGDMVQITMPYGQFRYRVTGTRIVAYNDMSVLRSPGHEVLRLQACHPRFFATHRIIVYALPVR
jgi:sortase A